MVKLLIDLVFTKRGLSHGFSMSLVGSSSQSRLWEMRTFTPLHIELSPSLYFCEVLVMFVFVHARLSSSSGVALIFYARRFFTSPLQRNTKTSLIICDLCWTHTWIDRTKEWVDSDLSTIAVFETLFLPFFTNNKHELSDFHFYFTGTRDCCTWSWSCVFSPLTAC